MECRETKAGVTFAVKVIPRASRNEVVGVEGDALKVRLTAPPVEGAANAALVDFLARLLGIPKSQVSLVHGEASRRKVVAVQGCSAAKIGALVGLRDRQGQRNRV